MTQQDKGKGGHLRRRVERVAALPGWTVSLDSLYKGEINNLCQHGLFIKTSKDIPVDSIVAVKLLPPETTDKAIKINAKVVWTRKDRQGNSVGMGIEFIEQTPKDKEVIAFYIDMIKGNKEERRY